MSEPQFPHSALLTSVNAFLTRWPSLQVHINVEQTIHRDDGDTEADLSPSESFKGRYLDSVTEKEASSP